WVIQDETFCRRGAAIKFQPHFHRITGHVGEAYALQRYLLLRVSNTQSQTGDQRQHILICRHIHSSKPQYCSASDWGRSTQPPSPDGTISTRSICVLLTDCILP